MSSEGRASEGKRATFRLPYYARAVIYGVAWLPARFTAAFVSSWHDDSFTRLRERAELPLVTERLLWLDELDKTLLFFPSVLALVLLIAADVSMGGLLRGSKREWLYWVWFTGVIVLAVLALAVVTTVLLAPVSRGMG